MQTTKYNICSRISESDPCHLCLKNVKMFSWPSICNTSPLNCYEKHNTYLMHKACWRSTKIYQLTKGIFKYRQAILGIAQILYIRHNTSNTYTVLEVLFERWYCCSSMMAVSITVKCLTSNISQEHLIWTLNCVNLMLT
jgi:hypothetical protein